MTIRGRVENGMIKVLDGRLPADGTEITFHVPEQPLRGGSTVDEILALGLKWHGTEEEYERLQQMIRDDREQDLRLFGG